MLDETRVGVVNHQDHFTSRAGSNGVMELWTFSTSSAEREMLTCTVSENKDNTMQPTQHMKFKRKSGNWSICGFHSHQAKVCKRLGSERKTK